MKHFYCCYSGYLVLPKGPLPCPFEGQDLEVVCKLSPSRASLRFETMAVASSSAAAQATPCAIANAHSLIKKHVHETPLLTSRNLDALVSTASSPDSSAPRLRLFFKCENFQRIGAFKARGAFHAVLQLIASHGEDEIRRKGVITHSSGE